VSEYYSRHVILEALAEEVRGILSIPCIIKL
jgi:hypothetical protein